MSWAEKKIEEYKQGKNATWLEKRALEHGNPVNCIAHIIAVIIIVYGLWLHDFIWIIAIWIIAGMVIAFIGHLYVWLKK